MSSLRHAHVGIFVENLERSAAFYRDIMGGSLQEALVLAEDLTIQHVLFGDFDIELLKQADPVESCDGAINHLCFGTDDAKAECERIRESGYEIEEELVENEFVAYFFFRGPDRERIEIVQRKKVG